MDIPLIHKFEAGYRAGAHYVCPTCRVLVGYAGVTGDAFKNPAKGKELALAQYAAGADIIFHAAGTTGLGVFEAARETRPVAIGVDADQWDEAPGRVLTSMIKQVDVAVFDDGRGACATGSCRAACACSGSTRAASTTSTTSTTARSSPTRCARASRRCAREIIAGKIEVPDR